VKGLGLLLCFGLVSALPASVLACTYPLPDPVEGESNASYSQRTEKFIRDWSAEGSRLWQAHLFDDASRIFLGRVVARRDTAGIVTGQDFRTVIDRPPVYEADILPIAAIRGDLPAGPQMISWQLERQCRFFEPGKAASADVGTPVLLFEVNGAFDGFPIAMARDPRLMAALNKLPTDLKGPGK
jgi:hypothetical protein